MAIWKRGIARPWPLQSATLAVGGLFFVLGWPGAPGRTGPAAGVSLPKSERPALQPRLRTGGMTLIALYMSASALERAAVARVEHDPALEGGTQRLALESLASPAARQFAVTETPTFLLYGRNGQLLLRCSSPEAVERALVAHPSIAQPASRHAMRNCPLLTAPRLPWVEEASPKGRRIYRRWDAGREPVPDIYKALSLRPDLMNRVAELTDRAHFRNGYLPERTKELIATYVSSLNRCGYCRSSHAENLRALGVSASQTAAVLRPDLKGSALTPKEHALMGFVKTLTLAPAGVTNEQIAQLRRLGWRDGEIFEAAFDASLFAFFNRIAGAYGLD